MLGRGQMDSHDPITHVTPHCCMSASWSLGGQFNQTGFVPLVTKSEQTCELPDFPFRNQDGTRLLGCVSKRTLLMFNVVRRSLHQHNAVCAASFLCAMQTKVCTVLCRVENMFEACGDIASHDSGAKKLVWYMGRDFFIAIAKIHSRKYSLSVPLYCSNTVQYNFVWWELSVAPPYVKICLRNSCPIRPYFDLKAPHTRQTLNRHL